MTVQIEVYAEDTPSKLTKRVNENIIQLTKNGYKIGQIQYSTCLMVLTQGTKYTEYSCCIQYT